MIKNVLFSLFCIGLLSAAEKGENEKSREIGKYTPVHYYKKSPEATAKIDRLGIPVCFWYNPKIWRIEKEVKSPYREIYFTSNKKGLRGAIIVEPIPMRKEEIESMVWERAEYNFDEVDFSHKDTRMVNGIVIDYFEWTGTFAGENEGIGKQLTRGKRYTFNEYIHTGPKGTIHIITYCDDVDAKGDENFMQNFLNGIAKCPASD